MDMSMLNKIIMPSLGYDERMSSFFMSKNTKKMYHGCALRQLKASLSLTFKINFVE